MTEPPTRPAQAAHIPALDGIRGLAIALVMFQHVFMGLDHGEYVIDKVVFSLSYRSWMGVDLFFVLSGFLITGILWQAKGSDGYFRNFYVRRVLRIFPAYYSVLVVFFLVLPLFGHAGLDDYVADTQPDQVWHWTYLTNLRIAWRETWYLNHVPNVFWSLAIEEQFYLVWPVVVLLCGRRTLMALCGVLFGLALAIRIAIAIDPDINHVTSFVLTPARMDGLVLGSYLALALRSVADPTKTLRVAWAVLGLAFLPLAILELPHSEEGWEDSPVQALRFSLIALVFGAMLWLSVVGRPGSLQVRFFASRFLGLLGKYSYAMYLWHGPMIDLVRYFFDPDDHDLILGSRLPVQFPYAVLCLGATFLAAWLSWWLIEVHFLRLKHRFAQKAAA